MGEEWDGKEAFSCVRGQNDNLSVGLADCRGNTAPPFTNRMVCGCSYEQKLCAQEGCFGLGLTLTSQTQRNYFSKLSFFLCVLREMHPLCLLS